MKPEQLARLSGIQTDTRVLLFVLVVSLLTGLPSEWRRYGSRLARTLLKP